VVPTSLILLEKDIDPAIESFKTWRDIDFNRADNQRLQRSEGIFVKEIRNFIKP